MKMIFFAFITPFLLFASPSYYLTWNDDPTTTMIISWFETTHDQMFSYKAIGANWHSPTIERTALSDTHTLARVQLVSLTPDTAYQMRFNSEEIESFKTLPNRLDKPLHFVAGGDAYYGSGKRYRKMCRSVAKKKPAFVVMGGDIAYTLKKGLPKGPQTWEIKRWEKFFDIWSQEMGPIPILAAIGNHDISRKNGDALERYLVKHLFAFNQTYRAFILGNYALLVLLDTSHFSPIEGAQTRWLDSTLSKYAHLPFKSAHYHAAAHPSYASYNGMRPKRIRKNWVPLFEQYHLTVGFENHNHAYKRTYPLLNGQPHPDGIVYLGDGSWGVPPRKPYFAPYLAKTAAINAFYLITLSQMTTAIDSYDIKGHLIEKIKP